jgi:hypothetical protein
MELPNRTRSSTPRFPPEQKLRYFIDDGTVLDYNPGPFLVRDRTNQNDGA